jgi:hypothetical protein
MEFTVCLTNKFTAAIFFVLISLPVGASANSGKCDSILIQQTSSVSLSQNSKLSYLKIVTRENYEEAKRGAQGQAYANLFSGSYDEFIVKRQRFFTSTSYQRSLSLAREEFKSFLNEGQISGWVACMQSNNEMYSHFKDVDTENATLVIGWEAPASLGALSNVEFRLQYGSTKDSVSQDNFAGEEPLIIERDSTNHTIRGHIKGKLPSGFSKQANFFLPPLPEIEPPIFNPPYALNDVKGIQGPCPAGFDEWAWDGKSDIRYCYRVGVSSHYITDMTQIAGSNCAERGAGWFQVAWNGGNKSSTCANKMSFVTIVSLVTNSDPADDPVFFDRPAHAVPGQHCAARLSTLTILHGSSIVLCARDNNFTPE